MESQEIYNILKNGSPEERIRFIESAPENSFKNSAIGMIGSENVSVVVLAITSLVMEYCNGSNPSFGSALAEATHSLALEVYNERDDHGGLIATTLSNLASQYLNALNLMGRSEEVIMFADKYIPFYESMNEMENLPTLYCAKANALLNLNQIDDAEEILKNIDSSLNPGARIEINRLLGNIAKLKDKITSIDSTKASQQKLDLADLLKDTLGSFGEDGGQIQSLLENLSKDSNIKQSDYNDNEQFQQALEVLKKGEEFITKKSGADNEWTMKGRLREATKIFKLDPNPSPKNINLSFNELSKVIEWAEEHKHMELMNDALWGIYLCYSRQNESSKAADTLISLRTNLETQRAGIADPFERGGAFSTYPQLFNALCEKLQHSKRYFELLEAMEASKGRGIADILTSHYGHAIADTDIYGSVSNLPLLTEKFKFHYLSYYVDRFGGKSTIHQVLVGKDGKVYGTDSVVFPDEVMDSALNNLDPKMWGKLIEDGSGLFVEDASEQLSPLVEFLSELTGDGIIEKGDHICYTADENLNNLPLHYLPFHEKRLIDFISLSRIHNSLQLEVILKSKPDKPDNANGFIVPALQDVKSKNWENIQLSLNYPTTCLTSIMTTNISQNETVSIEHLKYLNLNNSILHFSSHGFFPAKDPDKNPFTNSGALISDGKSLPDKNKAARGEISHLLSPEKLISNEIKMKNSHVTLMACVSGLSREGLGGDALGLDWALVQAGATSILASHWMVSAADAAGFFELFYEKWLKEKQSRGHAFRETVNELRSKDGHTAEAHCWAAFSLSGDWR